jgi:type I restriction enzyme M protein
MFVQTGHFLEDRGTTPAAAVTFHAQEKSDTTVNLARMNMAVHGLEGANIRQGNTYYDRREELIGRCHFVMANPPFNVDMVDPDRIKTDPRLFTQKKIPGISAKTKTVSNANYLWIQYFYSYLNPAGRAGFIMASSATDAGHGERDIRREIIQTGHVDVIIAIGTNFFYTRSLPCTLWFFDKGKPANYQDQVLMLDARAIYRVVTRKIRDFSDEQLHNLAAIVWLYRGQTARYLELVSHYLHQAYTTANHLPLTVLDEPLAQLRDNLDCFAAGLTPTAENGAEATISAEQIDQFRTQLAELAASWHSFQAERDALAADLTTLPPHTGFDTDNQSLHALRAQLDPFVPRFKAIQKGVTALTRDAARLRDLTEKELKAREAANWDAKTIRATLNDLEAARDGAVDTIKATLYWHTQATWLQTRFPDGIYTDVPGLCKAVTRDEIYNHDDSLTPGRYVGVAPLSLEDNEDFEERIAEIHLELEGLDQEAVELAALIKSNFENLGI